MGPLSRVQSTTIWLPSWLRHVAKQLGCHQIGKARS
jgi:hypothetical protein